MITILFTSRAVAVMDETALSTLLTAARERNAQAQVTGMLLYAYGSFVQQLEGEADAVDRIFASIARDPRHTELRLLSRRPISRRRYPDWTMGFEHPDPVGLGTRLPGYRRFSASPPMVHGALITNGEMAENLLAFLAAS